MQRHTTLIARSAWRSNQQSKQGGYVRFGAMTTKTMDNQLIVVSPGLRKKKASHCDLVQQLAISTP
jgi:hypothetical protein